MEKLQIQIEDHNLNCKKYKNEINDLKNQRDEQNIQISNQS